MASQSLPGLRRERDDQESNAPMMAVFGGMFALMLVFLLLINIFSEQSMRERLKQGSEDGMYSIELLDGGHGFVIITFPQALRIVETGESVPLDEICEPNSAYRQYADHVYSIERDQFVFINLEGSIPLMAKARNCLMEMWPNRLLEIGWIPADNEFLKSVFLDDIPMYIRDYSNQP